MSPRDTGTGDVFEKMIPPALERGKYKFEKQVVVGKRLGGGSHKVDFLLTCQSGKQIVVSTKWQQVSGTAEQKVPYEIMCLAQAIRNSNGALAKAYLVLGGGGWRLRDFYLGNGLREYMKNCGSVEVMSLETFVAEANQGRL